MNDTIAAISTALGVGAISIIRISGPESIEITNKIFKGKDLTTVPSHTINYGYIISNEEIIDEVLVSVMKAPKTFTKEDIVEINCHGGIATTNKVLELLLINSAKLAEPGEFTKRAFLNGRINLLEAEGIMNLISSKTEVSRKMSINQLSGKVGEKIKNLREKLIQIISNIEVNIDYPEYEDIEVLENKTILPDLIKIKEKIEETLKDAKDGKIINEGINIGIIGKPNVGKSSLLNALLEENKAIVTDIKGTTRDVVEGSIILKGVLLNFIDTAGIRKSDNLVEQIGIQKSFQIIDKSDLIIYILNNNEPIDNEEIELYNKIKTKKHIIILNKIDLETKINLSFLDSTPLKLSLANNDATLVKEEIIKMFNLNNLETKDLTYLSNARNISLLNKALQHVNISIENISNNDPIDIVELEIKECWNTLGEILGETYTDELLDELFQRFCLGK